MATLAGGVFVSRNNARAAELRHFKAYKAHQEKRLSRKTAFDVTDLTPFNAINRIVADKRGKIAVPIQYK
jgi:hypothetical protein